VPTGDLRKRERTTEALLVVLPAALQVALGSRWLEPCGEPVEHDPCEPVAEPFGFCWCRERAVGDGLPRGEDGVEVHAVPGVLLPVDPLGLGEDVVRVAFTVAVAQLVVGVLREIICLSLPPFRVLRCLVCFALRSVPLLTQEAVRLMPRLAPNADGRTGLTNFRGAGPPTQDAIQGPEN
jgi:hypothetical protein